MPQKLNTQQIKSGKQLVETTTGATISMTVAEAGEYIITASLYTYTGAAVDSTFSVLRNGTAIVSRIAYGQFSKTATLVTKATLAAGDVLSSSVASGQQSSIYIEKV